MPRTTSKLKGHRNQVGSTRRRRIRKAVFARDGYRCQWCGFTGPTIETYDEDGKRLNFLTVDHIVPVKWGGDFSVPNLRTLCYECNAERACDQTGVMIFQ